MRASEARERADKYFQKLVSDHDKEYKKMKAEERRKINALKLSGRFTEIINTIDGHVQRLAAEGKRDLSDLEYMAFYLKGADTILYDELKKHFTLEGYGIKEYADFGLQLQW